MRSLTSLQQSSVHSHTLPWTLERSHGFEAKPSTGIVRLALPRQAWRGSVPRASSYEGGIAGMVGAIGGEKVSPDMMIDAAMYIVAAWVASSQTKLSASQREEEVEELVEMLPWYIEYHRTAGWLSDSHRSDH